MQSTETIIALVKQAQAGDRSAFGELYELFKDRVFHVVHQRLRNTAEADEVSQEVFLRALRKLEQLKEPAAFPAWIKQIAVRLSINRAVRRPPETACEPSQFEVLQEAPEGATDQLLKTEDAVLLRDGISRLGEIDRETLVAFYFDGQSLKEMAASFDKPIGTIKRRLHTARHRLQDVLTSMQPV